MNKGNWYVRQFYDCYPDYTHELNTQKGPFKTKQEAYDFGYSYFDGYGSGLYTYVLWNSKTDENVNVEELKNE